MTGPEGTSAPGFSINLPEFDGRELPGLRVPVGAYDGFCPVSREVRERLMMEVSALRQQGAQVDGSVRPAFTKSDSHDTYQLLLQAKRASRTPVLPQERRRFSQRRLRIDRTGITCFRQLFRAGLPGVAYLPSSVIPPGLNDDGSRFVPPPEPAYWRLEATT
jgi:Asp-tRNA(Asn)/Glu-tRNA(Gln) amidotransferase A subunit family amidase